jgi:Transposase DDE domain
MIGSPLRASRDDFSGSSSPTADIFRKSYWPCSPEQGVQLITKIKKNMKNKLMPMLDKILLRKRALSETVNDQLKNICQIEHTRHRSVANFVVNLLAALVVLCHKILGFPRK